MLLSMGMQFLQADRKGLFASLYPGEDPPTIEAICLEIEGLKELVSEYEDEYEKAEKRSEAAQKDEEKWTFAMVGLGLVMNTTKISYDAAKGSRETWEAIIGQVNDRIKGIEADIAATRSRISTLNEEIAALRQDLADEEAKEPIDEKKIAGLRSSISVIEIKITAEESAILNLEGHIEVANESKTSANVFLMIARQVENLSELAYNKAKTEWDNARDKQKDAIIRRHQANRDMTVAATKIATIENRLDVLQGMLNEVFEWYRERELDPPDGCD
jgi:chromosome segregation ATPase